MEKISSLQVKVEKLSEENKQLKSDLTKFSDYDAFKKKFEKFTIEKESVEAERDNYKKKSQ